MFRAVLRLLLLQSALIRTSPSRHDFVMSQNTEVNPTLAPLYLSESWHEALSHPEGRDKLFRLLQYTAKLVRGVAVGRSQKLPEQLAPVAALEASLAGARQLWRMFKWTGFYTSTSLTSLSRERLSITRSNLSLTLLSLKDAFLALYFFLDNVAFLTKMSILRGDTSTASRRAARAWLVANLLGVGNCIFRLHALRMTRLSVQMNGGAVGNESEDRENITKNERIWSQFRVEAVELAKYAGDSVVALSLCGNSPAHPAIVGACGVVSSLVGCWQIWPRHAQRMRLRHPAM